MNKQSWSCGAHLRCYHVENFKLVGQMVLLNWDNDSEGGENAFNIEIKCHFPLGWNVGVFAV